MTINVMERERYHLVPFSQWDTADRFAGGNTYLLAPTEEATPWHLARMGLGTCVLEINQGACKSARQKGFPLAAVLGPIKESDFGALYANYHEQVKSLLFSDPELVALVGIRSLENLRAACVAVREFFTETVLFVTREPDERECALCTGFGVVPVRPVDGVPWGFEVVKTVSAGVLFRDDVILELGPGLPVAYVRWTGARAFLGQPGMGEIEIVGGKPGEIETACRQCCCRPLIMGAVPGERESRARMYAAAKFGGAVLVPLTGAEETTVNLPLLLGRAECAREEAAEAGVVEGSLFLDLTGYALSLPGSGFWLRALEAVGEASPGPVGLGRLPPAETPSESFLDLAAAKGAVFLPASPRAPLRIAVSPRKAERIPEPIGVS